MTSQITQDKPAPKNCIFFKIALILTLAYQCQCRIGPQTNNDGVTYAGNTYPIFNGKSGVLLNEKQPADASALAAAGITEYTVMIWFKATEAPWNAGEDFTIFQLAPSAFNCQLRRRQVLNCDSNNGRSLAFSIANIRIGPWYLMFLRAQNGKESQLQIRELTFNYYGSDNSSSFFPPGNSNKLQYDQIYFGINSDKLGNGFRGSLRNFKLLTSYMTDSDIQNQIYQKLAPASYSSLLVQVMMGSKNPYLNDVSNSKGSVVGYDSPSLTNYTDTMGSFLCTSTQTFDGYSCKNNNKKLKMNSDSDYAVTAGIPISSVSNKFTIELWSMNVGGYSGQGYFLTLYSADRITDIYAIIKQDSQTSLYCTPFYTANNNEDLNYWDHQSTRNVWQHISCVYDGSSQYMWGLLYQNSVDYKYQEPYRQSGLSLQPGTYNIVVNNRMDMKNQGIPNSYYSEIKFWSVALSFEEIQYNRYQQLDVNAVRSKLFSYLKLFSSGFTETDVDYAQSTLSRYVTYSPVTPEWAQNPDLLICPLAMFKDPSSNICYREGITSIVLTVSQLVNKGYQITPFFSNYRNNYVRAYSDSLYNYQWELSSYDTLSNSTDRSLFPQFLSAQQNNNKLFFANNQVANNPGSYLIKLTMQDKKIFQDPISGQVRFKTLNCLSIFVRNTNESFVYKDINVEKGQGDYNLYFNTTNCGSYGIDNSLYSYKVDWPSYRAKGSNMNPGSQYLTIKREEQSGLPSNTQFYVTITAGWRNVNNYNDVIYMSVIYGLRYIMKLAVQITASSDTALKGQDLTFITEGTRFVNVGNNQIDTTYTLSWVCPGNLNSYCSQSKFVNAKLFIPYDQFVASDLKPWEVYTIKLQGRTNFVQGSGSLISEDTASVIWFDINPDAKVKSLIKGTPIIQNVNSFQIDVENLDESQITIEWSTNPSLPSSSFINSNNRKQFAIKPNVLVAGWIYKVTGKLIYKQNNKQLWYDTFDMVLSGSPTGGKVDINPRNGKAFITEFTLTASNWIVGANGPALYQFFYQDPTDQKMKSISSIGSSNTFKTYLPSTTKVYVKVYDQNYAYGIASQDGSFSCAFDKNTNDTYNQLQAIYTQIQDNSNQVTVNMIQQISSIIGNIGDIKSYTGVSATKAILGDLTNLIKLQASKLDQFGDYNQKQYFFQSALQAFGKISADPQLFSASQADTMQDAILTLQYYPAFFDQYLNDDTFQLNFLTIQSNVISSMEALSLNSSLDKDSQLNSTSSKVRKIITNHEQYMSTRIVEGQQAYYDTPAFTFNITKYSRMANLLTDVNVTSSTNKNVSYKYPLGSATQPSERQSMSVIQFKYNPFLGSIYTDQNAMSNNSIYFAYRDGSGNYLSSDYVNETIEMQFAYSYPDFELKKNITVCGYINSNDSWWENKSCNATLDQAAGLVKCSCRHMSFYSIIEDNFTRPVPSLVTDQFRNGASLALFIYLLVVFFCGLFYTIRKDYKDFKFFYLKNEEPQSVQSTRQGSNEKSVLLVSLAFKRKVFFMSFSEEYKFKNLYKIFIMLMHPIFSLKYKLDPQVPRYYRFLVLFTRMIILMGIYFFTLRDHPDFQTIRGTDGFSRKVGLLILWAVLGSLIYLPLPRLFYSCFRSQYKLLIHKDEKSMQDFDFTDIQKKPKSSKRNKKPAAKEIPPETPKGGANEQHMKLDLDVSLPIKLLFLINAASFNTIARKCNTSLSYMRGGSQAVGKKLQQLDHQNSASALHHRQESLATERNLNANYQESNQKQKDQQDIVDQYAFSSKDKTHDDPYRTQNIEYTSKKMLRNSQDNSPDQGQIIKYKEYREEEEEKLPESQTPAQFEENEGNVESLSNSQAMDQHLDHPLGRSIGKPLNNLLGNNGEPLSESLYQSPVRMTQQFQPLEIQKDEDDVVDGISMTQRSSDDDSDEIQNEGGEGEEDNEAQQYDSRTPQKNAPRQYSGSILSNEDGMGLDSSEIETKEMIQQPNTWSQILGIFLLFLINGGIIAGVLYLYIHEKFYTQHGQYIWVIVFFISQAIGFFIIDFIVLWIMALTVSTCCKLKKVFLARFMRESLTLYEDYRYVVKFTSTRMN